MEDTMPVFVPKVGRMRPAFSEYDEGLRTLVKGLPEFSDIVEVGSWAGESTRIFLDNKNVRSITCVDPYDADLAGEEMAKHGDIKDAKFEFCVQVLANNPHAFLLQTTSVEAAKILRYRTYTMVYIDGLHLYESVKEDIMTWYPRVAVGGWIAGHDYQIEGVQKAVNEAFGVPDWVFEDTSWIVRKRQ